jgi:hypothetical protein
MKLFVEVGRKPVNDVIVFYLKPFGPVLTLWRDVVIPNATNVHLTVTFGVVGQLLVGENPTPCGPVMGRIMGVSEITPFLEE